jgi:uncharacterized membrane protein YagU involved in acid resistance
MVMALYRAKDCQKYVKYKMGVKGIILFTVVFAIAYVLYEINNPWLNIANIAFVGIYVFLANHKNLKSILGMLKHKKKTK